MEIRIKCTKNILITVFGTKNLIHINRFYTIRNYILSKSFNMASMAVLPGPSYALCINRFFLIKGLRINEDRLYYQGYNTEKVQNRYFIGTSNLQHLLTICRVF